MSFLAAAGCTRNSAHLKTPYKKNITPFWRTIVRIRQGRQNQLIAGCGVKLCLISHQS